MQNNFAQQKSKPIILAMRKMGLAFYMLLGFLGLTKRQKLGYCSALLCSALLCSAHNNITNLHGCQSPLQKYF
ncbi:MAG: hypothetical protein FWG68_02235 [Defluviitaleaceae bacterium]|nr:hypothetical protein [Defluviitaleaceae bacterium]